MKKYECDFCKKIVNPKDIFGLEICEIDEDDGNFGKCLFEITICLKCKNKFIKEHDSNRS